MLQNNPKLKSLIDDLWNKFWSGGISNPLTAIEQITYLLFMKRIDDLDTTNIKNADFAGDEYKSKFDGKFTLPHFDKTIEKSSLRWSEFRRMRAEDMLYHVQANVFPFLKELNDETSPFTHHMKNAVFIISKPALLVEAVKTIDKIFEEIENDAKNGGQTFQDIQGDVYEMLLSEIASAGKNGQFRTPRHIIKLICELLNPQLGNRIADPACGTGGFLLGAYQYLVTQLDKNKDDKKPDEDGFIRSSVAGSVTEKAKEILDKSFYGFDIDITMVRLGLMNLIMHGIDNPQINYKDTLSKSYTEQQEYDIILANPPFTGSIDKGDINEDLKLSTTKTELLFVERIFHSLRIGGSAGIIIPQGVLFGSGKAFVQLRKKLVEEAELKAVISMPSGVFKPYAGVATAILIFTKGGETNQTWFYGMEKDNYTLDDKRNCTNDYGDLQDIVTKYKSRNPEEKSDRKAKSFFVNKKEIVDNKYDLSYNQYKEIEYEEVKYDAPKDIICELRKIDSELSNDMNELEEMLG